MNGADSPVEVVLLAIAAALLAAGVASGWRAQNAVKRIASLMVGLVGAFVSLAVLGAPASALIATVATALAYVIIGAGLVVRLQEAYGVVEAAEIDAADDRDEPAEPRA